MDERNYPQPPQEAAGQYSPATGQLRAATPDEMYKLKQMQSNQAKSAPQPQPTTIHLIQLVVDAARGVHRESRELLEATFGEFPPSEANRDGLDGMKGELALAIRLIHEACGNLSNMRRLTGVLLLCLFLSGVAFAQKPAAPAPVADDNIACSNKVQPTTGFTECEMLRLSNYMSQLQAIKAESDKQVKPVADAGNEFIGKVVARNPGKQYESPSQQFPLGRLVPIPAPAPPTDPHTGQPAVAPTAAPTPAPAPTKQNQGGGYDALPDSNGKCPSEMDLTGGIHGESVCIKKHSN